MNRPITEIDKLMKNAKVDYEERYNDCTLDTELQKINSTRTNLV